jgi:hypothetical protein
MRLNAPYVRNLDRAVTRRFLDSGILSRLRVV